MGADSQPSDPQPEEFRDSGDPIRRITTYVYDSQDRITPLYDSQDRTAGVDTSDGRGPVTVTPSPRLFRWEHLKEKRLFALTDPYDGKTEYWRDNPTRYLVVEVDDETGEIKSAIKRRRPVYLWLCREEREAR